MNRHLLAVLTLCTTLLGTPAVSLADNYDYHFFSYPGAFLTQSFIINDRGLVAGNGYIGDDVFPFIYNARKQVITNVAPLAGYDSTAVLAISDSGHMAGAVDDGGTTRGYIRRKNGTTTVFSHPDSVSFTQPRGVNNRGQVAGFRDSPDDLFLQENAFIYDSRTGEFTDIVHSLFTLAQDINNKGEVVGSAIYFAEDAPCPADPGTLVRYAWMRDASGHVTYFQVNGAQTSARGITESGTIAGFTVFDGEFRGFVTELDGSQCQQITIPGDQLLDAGDGNTIAAGINSAGWVSVGTESALAIAVPKPGKKKGKK